jgi:hypothetical protein
MPNRTMHVCGTYSYMKTESDVTNYCEAAMKTLINI